MEQGYEAYKKYPFTEIFGTVVKQTVLQFFTDNPDKEFSVLDISRETNLNQSSLSKPLNELLESGLLESREDGKFKFYKLRGKYSEHFKQIYDHLQEVQAAALKDLKLDKLHK